LNCFVAFNTISGFQSGKLVFNSSNFKKNCVCDDPFQHKVDERRISFKRFIFETKTVSYKKFVWFESKINRTKFHWFQTENRNPFKWDNWGTERSDLEFDWSTKKAKPWISLRSKNFVNGGLMWDVCGFVLKSEKVAGLFGKAGGWIFWRLGLFGRYGRSTFQTKLTFQNMKLHQDWWLFSSNDVW
jgi:hypothetical protein